MELTNREHSFVQLAAGLAKFGGLNKMYVGSVVVQKNKVIGTGANRVKTHPLQKKYGGAAKQYLHAEIDAIIESLHKVKDLSKSTIYVIRRRRVDGVFSMALPCPSCMMAIKEAGIKKIVFSNWNGEIEKINI